VQPSTSARTMTLEAFADTVIPGEKRWPGDRAVAGVSTGGGAVTAGTVALLESEEGGLAEMLDYFADGLNGYARGYAAEQGVVLDGAVPPLVALPFEHRTNVLRTLLSPDHPEKDLWVGLAMFSFMAWDTGAYTHTADAIAAGHPGLTQMGFVPPGPDGLWRFPHFSYGRRLARPHPGTTATGSPA
jgi:enediyne biosynthesis protein E8